MGTASRTKTDLFLLVVLLFAQLLLMSGSARSGSGSSLLQTGVIRASQPVIRVTGTLAGGLDGFVSFLRGLRGAREENVRLRAEVARLQGEIGRYREESLENRRLRRALGMREDLFPRSVGATVVTTNLSRQSRMLVLDRGTSAGIRPDQAVVAWGGAVGRVVFADRDYAKVRLLSDPNSGVAGVIQRSRAEGMVLGRGEGPLDLAYVPKHADVVVGDRVVTSGLDGVFPRGLGIGLVSYVGDTAGASKAIRVEPEVDYGSMEEVLVLLEPVGGGLLTPPESGGSR